MDSTCELNIDWIYEEMDTINAIDKSLVGVPFSGLITYAPTRKRIKASRV
ncbi:hypothetical protein EYZ11_002701 [Aspergillus tanneri]|uniref:Uncharacterized protein n=1 Tax=Aspergillus tanneri TaxID=1220188 RepID=A0A4S3JSB3_9EURO|nr:hypothetical protein EYZ11_002701 [Aspergillus tanneri]